MMTRHLLMIFVLLMIQCHVSAQRDATEKEQQAFDRSQDCIRRTSTPFSLRIKNYPFDSSAQVQLVSFKRHNDTINGIIHMTGGGEERLPRKNDSIYYSRLFEIKNLTYAQVAELTDILYNYGYRGQLHTHGIVYTETMLQCYVPKNAILFLDARGRVIAFLEICFECDRTTQSSPKMKLGPMCNQKLSLLKDFFKRAGVEYGITKGLMGEREE